MPPPLGAQSLNHWNSREVPEKILFFKLEENRFTMLCEFLLYDKI